MKNKLIIIIFTSLFLISCGGNYSGNEESIIRSATSYRFVSGGDNGKIHFSYGIEWFVGSRGFKLDAEIDPKSIQYCIQEEQGKKHSNKN